MLKNLINLKIHLKFLCIVVFLCFLHFTVKATDVKKGLIGHWEFNHKKIEDLSGNGNFAKPNESQIFAIQKDEACVKLLPNSEPIIIPVKENSVLAMQEGTFCFWLNVAGKSSEILSYNNGAVQLKIYRGDFQVRFKGENEFNYSSGILDYNWPKYDMREWAFYGHPKAAVHDCKWHHFAVSYDFQGKQIIGWRDGELIAVVDLTKVQMEPLNQNDLTDIKIGADLIGFFDDLRVYNRRVSDAEIREIYDSKKAIFKNWQTSNQSGERMYTYKYQENDSSLYRAWLPYYSNPLKSNENALKTLISEGENSTIKTASEELKIAISKSFGFSPNIENQVVSGSKIVIGTPETSDWIKKHRETIAIEQINDDGFILKELEIDDEKIIVIAAKIPAGISFGTFDLIRRIQLGENLAGLNVIENPKIPIRLVNHWSYFRGLEGDKWRSGSRDNSIFSWEELKNGDTKLIRDWVRLMASAGWNAICPSEINWDFRDNFLEHLDEVEILAGILRDYGMKLYWSPSYLIALDPASADSLYSRVPDFGGYLMKMGSEKQNGDPRPNMVNRIADNLKPYGGMCLLRGFVYGNYRYTQEPYRHLLPVDIFAQEDGKFRTNVVLVPKGSAGDWDFSAPIPAIDGALNKTLRGSELVIDKNFPSSWVEKWKWWFEQDTHKDGPGSINKYGIVLWAFL